MYVYIYIYIYILTLKYQLQNNFEDTLTSNKTNCFFLFLSRASLQTSALGLCK